MQPLNYIKLYLNFKKTLSQNARARKIVEIQKKKGGNPVFLAIAGKITKQVQSISWTGGSAAPVGPLLNAVIDIEKQ